MDHAKITEMIGGSANYGKGIKDNPFSPHQAEWLRRRENKLLRSRLTEKIEMLFEPRFITPPETAEVIEALVTMTNSQDILEVGTCTGFTALHILRAIVGKPGARLVSIDARPAHDKEFFASPELAPHFEHIEGWTPQVFNRLAGRCFDMVFVDSDHTVEHCEKELKALLTITKPGSLFLFHDCPSRNTPADPSGSGTVYNWLHGKMGESIWRGACLRSCEQLDCVDAYGAGYNLECSPGLGIFVRR